MTKLWSIMHLRNQDSVCICTDLYLHRFAARGCEGLRGPAMSRGPLICKSPRHGRQNSRHTRERMRKTPGWLWLLGWQLHAKPGYTIYRPWSFNELWLWWRNVPPPPPLPATRMFSENGYVRWDELDLDFHFYGGFTESKLDKHDTSSSDRIWNVCPKAAAANAPRKAPQQKLGSKTSRPAYACPVCAKELTTPSCFKVHVSKQHKKPHLRGKNMRLTTGNIYQTAALLLEWLIMISIDRSALTRLMYYSFVLW